MKSFFNPVLFFLFVSIAAITNAQPYVDEIDPQRSIYVDKFVTYNVISVNNGNPFLDPANSILSVDENHDGIFEKERALLEYCMDHHVTSLVLLDLHKVLGKHVYAWNQNTNQNEDLEVHLCRFMHEARTNYCITEIIASGESSGFFHSATGTYANPFMNPSPPFLFTPKQKNSPAFNSSLLLAEDNTLQPGDDSYYFREFLKFYLRAAFFGRFGSCNETFNRLHMEYEFWQSGVDALLTPIINNPSFTPGYFTNSSCNCSIPYSSNQYYNSTSGCSPCTLHTYPNDQQGKFDLVFIPVINTIRSVKKLVNSGLLPSDPNYVKCEAYLHSLSTIPNWNGLQIFIDGNPDAAAQSSPLMTNDIKHLFDLTCPIGAGPTNPNPDYDMLPNIERPLPAEFNPCIGGNLTIPAHSLTEDGYQIPSNPALTPATDWFQNNTDVHFILNGESIANNGYDDYLGAWFPGNSNRNIFEAERIYYNEWRDECVNHIPPYGLNDPTTNDVHRGAVLWYTQTQIIPTNRHAPLQYQTFREHTKIFTSDNPWCGSPSNVVIHYIGPSESSSITPGNQVEIKFWITDCNGNAIAGQPSVTSPVITKTYSATYYFNNNLPYAAPDINLLLSPVAGCNFLVGHMKLTYNQGCTYEYQENLYINSGPTIAAMGNTTFCDGDFVILRASSGGVGATYAWTRNGQPISGATGIEYSATLSGDYKCQIGGSACTGLSNLITVTVNPNPPVSIITDCTSGNGVLICDYDLSGGPPYTQGPNGETYQWSTGETTNKITLLSSTYAGYFINVTVTTPAGCKNTDWKRYSTSGAIPFTVTPHPTTNLNLCGHDGSVDLSTTCACGPYRLRIYDGSHFQDDQWRVGQTHSFGGLDPGIYTAILTGSFGMCYSTASFTILPNSTTTINATITPSSPTCNSSTNGQLVISSITPGATNYIVTVNGVSHPNVGSGITISNLPPGSYPVRIENPGCSYVVFPVAPNTTISPAHEVSVTTTTTPSSCTGGSTGSANSSVTPSAGNYTYLWTPGNFNTANISSRPPGSYMVTVTDAWGCTANAYANISPPPAISITVVNQINPCQGLNNGSLELDLSGGNGSYNISPGTWNLNASGYYEQTGMGANTYTITATSGGCSATQSISLTPVSLTFNVTNATCTGHSNGSITAISTDGTGPFLYNWNPGGASPGSTLVNQPAGNYVCTVTDDNGCTASSTAIITNGGLIVSAIPGNISCHGGTTSVTVSATGGSGSYTGTGLITGVSAGQHTYTVNDNNGCSGSVTITILEPTIISVTALYNNILCNGSNTNITVMATGGTGVYTSGTGVFQNVSAGTYTYTVTDNNGCSGSTTVNLTQPLAVSAGSNATICLNQSTTLSASNAITYVWNPGNISGQNITVSPTTHTTYTVTGTSLNGCTGTATVTVTVNPLPSISIIPASPSSICFGDNLTLTASSGGNSYSWSPSTGLSCPTCPITTASPQATTTYSVVKTGTNSCTNSATVVVQINQNCCGSPASQIISAPGNLTGTYSSPPNKSLSFNVTVASGTTVIFSALDLSIASGVTITINPTGTLRIISGSHLHACGDMWGGINNNGGTVIIDGSIIEDAINAVHSSAGAPLTITNNTFDHNYTSLWMENGNYSSSSVYGNTFDNSGASISRPPYSGRDPVYHIFLNEVSNVIIGDAAAANTFINSENGIYSVNSNLRSYNNIFNFIGDNTFQHRLSGNPRPVDERAMAAINSFGGQSTVYTLYVSDGQPQNTNYFNGCFRGVNSNYESNVYVLNNRFDQCKQGIEINSVHKGTVSVIANNIDKYNKGINLSDVNGNFITVKDNNLNKHLGYDAGNYGYTGIEVQNYVLQGAYYNLNHNWVENTEYGIHLRNLTAYMMCIGCPNQFIGLNVRTNNIEEVIPDNDLTYPHIGIWLENVDGAILDANIVERDAGLPSCLDPNLMRGISAINSTRSTIEENSIRKTGAGIHLGENCSKTKLLCNTMNTCFNGVYIHGTSNKFSDQGSWTGNVSTSQSWRNQWYTINTNSRVVGSNVSGATPLWLFNPADGSDFDPGVIPPVVAIRQQCALSTTMCVPAPHFDNDDEREKLFGDAVYNESYYQDIDPEFLYNDKEEFYNNAKDDPNLLYLGSPDDLIYQHQYDSLKLTNIGKIRDIKENFWKYENSDAMIKLNSLVDQNTIEYNKKFTMSVFASEYAINSIPDSTTYAELENIALQNPFFGGEAVYYARAMLGLNIQDQIPQFRKRRPSHLSISDVRIYPNPAGDYFVFNYKNDDKIKGRLIVEDEVGKTVLSESINSNSTTIRTTQLVSGYYVYKFYSENATTITGKLVIIK